MSIAKENVLEEQKDDIIEDYGEKMLDQIVTERAERELYNLNYIFNV